MTLRIERRPQGSREVVSLIGRISSESLDELKAQMMPIPGKIALDLSQVTLVDVEAVHYLSDCARQGVEFLNCPAYIREWIRREEEREE